MPGETGSILDTLTLRKAMMIGGFFGVAVYNSFELYITIFRTFRRRRGLYFWSAICANTGIPVTSLFVMLRYLNIGPAGPFALIINFTWWVMVNSQSLMLYSRLHLVMGDPRKLRWVLWMIISTFVTLQVPTGTLFAIISFRHKSKSPETVAFDALDLTQLAVLGVQESALSGLYLYASRRTLKPMEIIKGPRVRKLLRELVGLLVLVIALDISLVVIQVTHHFDIQTTYKPVVYSIKLRVETFVLNNLVSLLVHPGCGCQQAPEIPSDTQGLNMTPNISADGSWRPRYVSSVRVTESADRGGAPNSAGRASLSTAWINESGRVQAPVKTSSL
ncbi:hypothetical protein F4859DRAFT_515258 [Xylaria cf. heliscus]|nr:hypothetical protein F4859DRAFT_515258 [Xylaria cf. heliscus]